MNSLLQVVAIGTFAGIFGTAGGGVIVSMIPRLSDHLMGLFLGLSGGIMLAVTFLDLIPEAFATGFIGSSFLGIASGMLLIMALDYVLPHIHLSPKESANCHFRRVGCI